MYIHTLIHTWLSQFLFSLSGISMLLLLHSTIAAATPTAVANPSAIFTNLRKQPTAFVALLASKGITPEQIKQFTKLAKVPNISSTIVPPANNFESTNEPPMQAAELSPKARMLIEALKPTTLSPLEQPWESSRLQEAPFSLPTKTIAVVQKQPVGRLRAQPKQSEPQEPSRALVRVPSPPISEKLQQIPLDTWNMNMASIQRSLPTQLQYPLAPRRETTLTKVKPSRVITYQPKEKPTTTTPQLLTYQPQVQPVTKKPLLITYQTPTESPSATATDTQWDAERIEAEKVKAYNNGLERIRILMREKADPDLKDRWGYSAKNMTSDPYVLALLNKIGIDQ